MKTSGDPRIDTPFKVLLRRHRRELEDSQMHVAALCGVRQPTIARWEAGTAVPEDEHAERALARYLGLPVSDLRRIIEHDRLRAERDALQRRLTEVDARIRTFSIE
jgi:transcriptional regulator with XRE-family HTH domain